MSKSVIFLSLVILITTRTLSHESSTPVSKIFDNASSSYKCPTNHIENPKDTDTCICPTNKPYTSAKG